MLDHVAAERDQKVGLLYEAVILLVTRSVSEGTGRRFSPLAHASGYHSDKNTGRTKKIHSLSELATMNRGLDVTASGERADIPFKRESIRTTRRRVVRHR